MSKIEKLWRYGRERTIFSISNLVLKILLLEANKMVSILCKKRQNLKARFFISEANSAIHKAAVQCSAGGWNDLRDHFSHPPHSRLKEIFRNCPRQSHGMAGNREAGGFVNSVVSKIHPPLKYMKRERKKPYSIWYSSAKYQEQVPG